MSAVPLWEREGYESAYAFVDDLSRKLLSPQPTVINRQIARLELPAATLTLDQRQVTKPDSQSQVLNGSREIDKSWIFKASLRQPRMPHGLIRKLFGFRIGHNKSPYVARAVTRRLAGAFLTAFGWLQRKARARQAAGSSAQPVVPASPPEPCWGDR